MAARGFFWCLGLGWLFVALSGCLGLGVVAYGFPRLRSGSARAMRFRNCGEVPRLRRNSDTAERIRRSAWLPQLRRGPATAEWFLGSGTCLRALFGVSGARRAGCSRAARHACGLYFGVSGARRRTDAVLRADLAKVVGRSRAAHTQLSRRPSEDLAQVLQPIEQLSATKIMRALDPRRQGEATFFLRFPPHNLIIS